MSAILKPKDLSILKRFIPLNTLSDARFSALIDGLNIEQVSKGSVIFEQGDNQKEFIYLISGSISLYAGEMEMEVIATGSEASRFAIAHQLPRKVKGLAQKNSRIVRVPTSKLDQEKSLDVEDTYMVDESPDEGGDWMATMLQSPVFQRLPAANLQKVMMKMEEVAFEPGETVVKQGDPADYYYIIKRGSCELTRQSSSAAKPIKLAELHDCASFGEDALLSDAPRNVTVTMKSGGQLLRLIKDDFISLVKEPVLQYIEYGEAQEKAADGAAWLDVREQDAYQADHVEGSINIPFFSLRMKVGELKHDQLQLLVCEDGRTSEAAAFLLLKFGFNASILKGGMEAVAKVKKTKSDDVETAKVAEAVAKQEEVVDVSEAAEIPAQSHLLAEAEKKIEELEKLCASFNEEQNKISIERDSLLKDRDRQVGLAEVAQSSMTLYKDQVEALETSQATLMVQSEDKVQALREEKEKIANELDLAKTELLNVEGNKDQSSLDLKQLQQQYEQLQSGLVSKESEVEQQSADLINMQQRVVEAEKQAEESQSSLGEVDKVKLDAESRLLDMQKELDSANQLSANKDDEINDLKALSEDKAQAAEKEIEELANELTVAKRELTEFEGNKDQTLVDLKQLQQQYEQLQSDLAGKENQIEQQNTDLSSMQQRVVEGEEQAEERRSSLEKENQQLKDERSSSSSEVGAVQVKLKAIEVENEEFQALLAEANKDKIGAESRLLAIQVELDDANQASSTRADEVDSLQAKLTELELAKGEVNLSAQEQGNKNKELRVEIKTLCDELNQEQQKLSKKQSSFLESQQEVAKLKDDKEAVENKLADFVAASSSDSNAYAEKSAEVEQLSEDLIIATSSIEDSAGTIQSLEGKHSEMVAEIDEGNLNTQRIQEELDSERSAVATLKQELVTEQESKQDSVEFLDTLVAERQEVEDSLKQKLNSIQDDLIAEREAKDAAIESLDEANAKINNSSSSVQKLTEKLQQVTDEKEAGVQKVQELETRSVEFQKQVDASSKLKESMELSLVEVERTNSSEQEKFVSLEREFNDHKLTNEKDVQQLTLSLQASQKEVGDLSLKLDELLDIKVEMENEKSSLEQSVLLYEQNKQALTENIKTLENKLSGPEEKEESLVKISFLEKQLDETQTALVDIEVKLSNANTAMESEPQDESSELLAVKSELLLVREQTEGDIKAMQEMLESSAKMNMALKKELLSLQTVANSGGEELEQKKKKKGLWR